MKDGFAEKKKNNPQITQITQITQIKTMGRQVHAGVLFVCVLYF